MVMDSDTDSAPSSTPDANVSADTPAPSANSGTAAQDAPSASSSDAPPVSEHEGLLAVVRKVVQPDAAKNLPQSEAAEAGPTPDAAAVPSTPDPLDSDPTDAELKDFPSKSRKRVERLLSQRNSLRTEVESLKEPAAHWQQMHGYLTANKLAAEDVNLLLGVGAALRRGDFKAFRDGVAPYWQLANEALGDFLPTDLHEKVETGEMTRDVAAEVSRMRYANARLQGQAQQSEREVQQDTQSRTAQAVRDAVTVWEQGIMRRDPDYAKKAGAVLRISQALMAENGQAVTPDVAVQIAQRAYEETNTLAGNFQPLVQRTRSSPDSTRVVNGARPQPRTLMEAALLGLERSRATH
jgi:hypothetical protein